MKLSPSSPRSARHTTTSTAFSSGRDPLAAPARESGGKDLDKNWPRRGRRRRCRRLAKPKPHGHQAARGRWARCRASHRCSRSSSCRNREERRHPATRALPTGGVQRSQHAAAAVPPDHGTERDPDRDQAAANAGGPAGETSGLGAPNLKRDSAPGQSASPRRDRPSEAQCCASDGHDRHQRRGCVQNDERVHCVSPIPPNGRHQPRLWPPEACGPTISQPALPASPWLRVVHGDQPYGEGPSTCSRQAINSLAAASA